MFNTQICFESCKIIDSILILNQVQKGQLIFRPKKSDIADLCNEIISDMRDFNGTRKISIKLSRNFQNFAIWSSFTAYVISNLLSKDIKYSQKDSLISIVLSYDVNVLEIELRDNGNGIPRDEMKNVFKLFGRAFNVTFSK